MCLEEVNEKFPGREEAVGEEASASQEGGYLDTGKVKAARSLTLVSSYASVGRVYIDPQRTLINK